MKIERKIERRITVTAEAIYTALSKLHDLPSCDWVAIEADGCAVQQTEIVLVASSRDEQELAV